MKSFIVIAIPTLFFFGCTSTASQTRTEMSGQKKFSHEGAEVQETTSISSIQASENGSAQLSLASVEMAGATETDGVDETEEAAEAETESAEAVQTSQPRETPNSGSSNTNTESASTTQTTPTTPASSSTSAARIFTRDEEATRAPVRIGAVTNVNAKRLAAFVRAASASTRSDTGASTTNEDHADSEETSNDGESEAPRPPATTTEVLRAVNQLRGLSSWTVIPFAHFRRGDRHAVVAWPAINSGGQLVDATVVGICLEETDDGGLEECGRRWVVRERAASRSALIEALGGTDYQVLGRSSGASLDELGPRLATLGSEFSSAVSSGNRTRASQAAVAATRLLPLDRVAFENGVARLLYSAAHYEGRLDHVSTVRDGDTATLTFHVRRGILRLQTITATARPVNGNTNRWIIVSYR